VLTIVAVAAVILLITQHIYWRRKLKWYLTRNPDPNSIQARATTAVSSVVEHNKFRQPGRLTIKRVQEEVQQLETASEELCF